MVKINEFVCLTRDCEAVGIPEGDPVNLKKDMQVYVQQALGGHHTVITHEGRMVRISGKDADAIGGTRFHPLEKSIRSGATVKEMVSEQLRTCFDPEVPANIVDLGLVYDRKVTELRTGGYRVEIKMTLTAPGCGMGEVLKEEVEEKMKEIPGVEQIDIQLVFDPPWSKEMISQSAKLQLGLL